MRQAPGVAVMRVNSGTPSVEIRTGNALNFLFSSTPISVAPATSCAAGCVCVSWNNSANDVGRRNLSEAPT